MKPEFTVHTRIQKPVAEVFAAVSDPKKLSGYFTTGGASAPLTEGTTVYWAFADNPGDEEKSFPVEVKAVIPNERIVLAWDSPAGGKTRVVMDFESAGGDTIVHIHESGWPDDDAGVKASYGNCFGWAQMLSALKAYLEYGINLRKGAHTGLFSKKDDSDRDQ